jgi:hypothetical protein
MRKRPSVVPRDVSRPTRDPDLLGFGDSIAAKRTLRSPAEPLPRALRSMPKGHTLWHHAAQSPGPAQEPLLPASRPLARPGRARSFVPCCRTTRGRSISYGMTSRFVTRAIRPLFGREAETRIAQGCSTIFVDEVQRVPELLDEAHRLIEAHKVRFLFTGSSARKLMRGGANLLAGRASIRRLHPLTMAEQGKLFDLERTLRFGSLPAVGHLERRRDARELLRSYGDTYVREEVQAESLVRNLGGVRAVSGRCGEPMWRPVERIVRRTRRDARHAHGRQLLPDPRRHAARLPARSVATEPTGEARGSSEVLSIRHGHHERAQSKARRGVRRLAAGVGCSSSSSSWRRRGCSTTNATRSLHTSGVRTTVRKSTSSSSSTGGCDSRSRSSRSHASAVRM